MIETSSDLHRSSLAIFENLRKIFGNVRVAFGKLLENLRKSSLSGRNTSENRQKRRFQYVYKTKNNTRLLVDMEFLFSCSTLYLTCSLRSLVRYQVSLYRHECFSGKQSTRKIHRKPHPGLEWRIFQILTSEDMGDFADIKFVS